MTLGELLRGVSLVEGDSAFKLVKGVTDNSKEVKKGYLFFAIKGFKKDGNEFIRDALKRGAVGIVTDSLSVYRNLKGKFPIFLTKNARKSLSITVAKFYGNPHKSIDLIGITGTNGKTTVSYLLYTALNRLEIPTAIIGTVKTGTWKEEKTSVRTTPSSVEFFKTLKEFKKKGCKWVVMETSSHGLELFRTYPAEFTFSCFTNLTRDHLDFHKTMENYFTAKEKLLFSTKKSVFVNVDDKYGRLLFSLRNLFPCRTISYGEKGEISFKCKFLKEGTEITINDSFSFKTNLKGTFNCYNLVAAYGILKEMGIEEREIKETLKEVKIPGRLEEVEENVFVDYAHTPDALKNVLKTLASLKPSKIITVFGCGGNRDKEKRALMGRIAEEYSSLVILTTDNPRWEEPEEIVKEILKGIKDKSKVKVILDREEAIVEALKEKGKNDIVLIAGKGHENYQEIKGKKIPFSDKEVVLKFTR